jgi:hypothetical protein
LLLRIVLNRPAALRHVLGGFGSPVSSLLHTVDHAYYRTSDGTADREAHDHARGDEGTGKQKKCHPSLFSGAFSERAQLVLQILGKQVFGFGQR